MFKSFLALFQESTEQSDNSQYTVEMATAALLCEIMRADRDYDEREVAKLKTILQEQFTLESNAIDDLVQQGKERSEEAVDLVQFTKVINARCDNEQKHQMIRNLWRIAYADKQLDPLEEFTIRRIADLLYIPHNQFIKAKLDVVGE